MVKNKGQFSRGKDASKMGKKGGKATGGNPENLKNVGTEDPMAL